MHDTAHDISKGGANRWAVEALASGTTFKQSCQMGQARPDDIDDWVDVWHTAGDGAVRLQQFLGFTDAEYNRWVQDSSTVYEIVRS